MKLIILLSVIIISLIISMFVTRHQWKRNKNYRTSFLFGLLINLVILSSASIWWFFTETDGISQVTGIYVNGFAIIISAILNLIVITVIKGKDK